MVWRKFMKTIYSWCGRILPIPLPFLSEGKVIGHFPFHINSNFNHSATWLSLKLERVVKSFYTNTIPLFSLHRSQPFSTRYTRQLLYFFYLLIYSLSISIWRKQLIHQFLLLNNLIHRVSVLQSHQLIGTKIISKIWRAFDKYIAVNLKWKNF